MRYNGRGPPGRRSWLALATYSSNWPRDEGYLTSTVLTANPPRKTHFRAGCQAMPSLGWKLLLSRAFNPVLGWTKAPRRPVTGSVAFGSKLCLLPILGVEQALVGVANTQV